jgi:hypothetical protein
MEDEARREATKMPVLNDIMDNKVIGPAIRQERAEGQVEIVLSLIRKRLGRISPAVGRRIATLKPAPLKRVGLRLLDAERIDDLFTR